MVRASKFMPELALTSHFPTLSITDLAVFDCYQSRHMHLCSHIYTHESNPRAHRSFPLPHPVLVINLADLMFRSIQQFGWKQIVVILTRLRCSASKYVACVLILSAVWLSGLVEWFGVGLG